MDILCIIVAIIAVALTVMELSSFESVSYRNYGQVVSEQFYRNILISKLFFSEILKPEEVK